MPGSLDIMLGGLSSVDPSELKREYGGGCAGHSGPALPGLSIGTPKPVYATNSRLKPWKQKGQVVTADIEKLLGIPLEGLVLYSNYDLVDMDAGWFYGDNYYHPLIKTAIDAEQVNSAAKQMKMYLEDMPWFNGVKLFMYAITTVGKDCYGTKGRWTESRPAYAYGSPYVVGNVILQTDDKRLLVRKDSWFALCDFTAEGMNWCDTHDFRHYRMYEALLGLMQPSLYVEPVNSVTHNGMGKENKHKTQSVFGRFSQRVFKRSRDDNKVVCEELKDFRTGLRDLIEKSR